MRRLLLMMVLVTSILTACSILNPGDGEEAGPAPTSAPTSPPVAPEDESPREPSMELPPTWTPSPALNEAAEETPPPGGGTGDVGDEPAPVEPDENDEVYVVVAGDTLAQIANRFGVDVNTLADVNNIENIDVIEIGQRLVIPRN